MMIFKCDRCFALYDVNDETTHCAVRIHTATTKEPNEESTSEYCRRCWNSYAVWLHSAEDDAKEEKKPPQLTA